VPVRPWPVDVRPVDVLPVAHPAALDEDDVMRGQVPASPGVPAGHSHHGGPVRPAQDDRVPGLPAVGRAGQPVHPAGQGPPGQQPDDVRGDAGGVDESDDSGHHLRPGPTGDRVEPGP
jgi:hypothetical protein